MFWLNKKQKNRRFNRRGHVLDVKLRSDQVRATRIRLGALAFGVCFGTVMGLLILWRVGSWTLDRLVYENSSFAIQEIKVQTDGVIGTEQLRQWSGAKLGDNLFALDLAKVKRALELVPAIQSVSVERILPRTLRISVNEREPIAQMNVSTLRPGGGVTVKVFQVDADGFVMLPIDSRDRAVPLSQQKNMLPVISGLDPTRLQPGRQIADVPQLQAALQLISAFQRSPMAGLVDLKNINVLSPQVLVVTTDQGSQMTFGLENLDQQLLRWRALYDSAKRTNQEIASMNLAVTKNTPAVLVSAGSLLPGTPKPVQPLRTTNIRRRNV